MIVRRVGLALAVLLTLGALPSAWDIGPVPATGGSDALPVAVAVLSTAIALLTLVLVVPAWRGRAWACLTIGIALLAGILAALPAFFAPADLLPAGGVLVAGGWTLVTIAVFAMIVVDASPLTLQALAVIVVVAVYASTVSGLSALVPDQAQRLVQTVTAVAVALLYGPIVALLRRTVGRALYGGRIDPAATAWLVGGRAAGDADVVAAAIDDAATALRLPRIDLLAGARVIARGGSGTRSGSFVTVPLRDGLSGIDPGGDDQISLRVTLPAGQHRLHRDDRAALQLVGLPLVLLARESALLDEVRTARAAVADVREREQLGLHRDLHDSLGPLLTGAVLRADAARNLLPDDPEAASAQLDIARSDLRSAVDEVRRVVYRLWPLELEQRGLWGAITARAARSGAALELPDTQPELSPAVQLAIYRIISEALTNSDRHAAGTPASVSVRGEVEGLDLTVANRSLPVPGFTPGMGITSIRARAEELGGHAEIGPTADGWRVRVWLPRAGPDAIRHQPGRA